MITRTEAIEAKIKEGRAIGTSNRPYQTCGINWLSTVGRCILADDMGLGKSKQSLEAAKLCNAEKTLIICPKSAINVWDKEIQKWTGNSGIILKGNVIEKRRKFEEVKSGYCVSTYGSLSEIKDIKYGFDVLIFDEAHRLKNPKAWRSKYAYGLQRKAENVFMLTGTPILNNPGEIWSLLHILYPKIFTSFWSFVREHCVIYFDGYKEQIAGIIDEEIYKYLIEPIILRRLREECLDLPPIQRQIIPVTMDIDQQKVYKKIAHIEMEGLSDSQIKRERKKRITRIRQAALSPKSIGYNVVGGKLKAAKDIIEGTEDRIVVFSYFIPPLRELMEMIDRPSDIFYGDLTINQRKKVGDGLMYGDTEVLFATIGSAGESIDLTRASIVIFLDRDWTPGPNDQAEARVYRDGQTKKVHVYILELQNTIDEDIRRVIERKAKTIDSLINSLKISHNRYIVTG